MDDRQRDLSECSPWRCTQIAGRFFQRGVQTREPSAHDERDNGRGIQRLTHPQAVNAEGEWPRAATVELLAEELKELEEAIQAGDIVAVADALCDLQYVLSGAVLEFGLGDKFNALFDEVQRSNMSKACATEQEALETVEFYKSRDNTDCYYLNEGDKWLVYRKGDNKTIKSKGYSPADLESILKE